MIQLGVSTNLYDLKRRLTELEKIEVPFAFARALTDTAWAIGRAEQDEMRRVFRAPTRWTLGTIRVDKADKGGKPATVRLAEFSGKGTPAARYLQPQIKGGRRGHTPMENRLIRSGWLREDEFLVPGRFAKMKGGNLSPGQVTKILSDLGTIAEARKGPSPRNRGRRSLETYYVDRGGEGSFFGRRTSKAPAGIYLNRGARRRLLVFLIVRAPKYRAIFDFRGVAAKTMQRELAPAFRRRLAEALKSSRHAPRFTRVAA